MKEFLEIFWLGVLGIAAIIFLIVLVLSFVAGIAWFSAAYPITMIVISYTTTGFFLIVLVGIGIKAYLDEGDD